MIQLEVWGPYALFTRGEMKVERVSYDVPTPSAARGIVESLYYHPGIRWHIRRIYVLNPIEFTTIRRNEVKSKILGSTAMRIAQGKEDEPYLVTTKQIVQRASMVLTNVHYVIEAEFEMLPEKAASWNYGIRIKIPYMTVNRSMKRLQREAVRRLTRLCRRGM